MKWNKRPVAPQEVRRLHDVFGVDFILASILARRGIGERSQMKFYVENGLAFLHNPFLFDDMETVVDRIEEAVEGKEKIRIFGDRDSDGITSTCLLVQELQAMGASVDWRLPEGDNPYGLTIAEVDEAASDGVTLLITVDCGISSFAEIAHAREKGIDALVLDHHISDAQVPPALAIIDPKMEGSGYPFPDLAACGVVAKVIWALRFSHTDLYHEPCILLHAHPGRTDTVVIQAVKLENLVETDRLFEEINPGTIDLASSKAVRFLSDGSPILVVDAGIEAQQLRTAFGKQVDMALVDMRPEMEKVLPMVKGRSLYVLSTMSRAGRYAEEGMDELEALVSLFKAFVMKKYPDLDGGYDRILDLVAIGTIADLMPMRDENRILVRRGLRVIEKGTRTNLQPLLAMQKLIGKALTSQDISWSLTPVINAAGRMGKPDVALRMLLAPNVAEAEKLARELEGLNADRKREGDETWSRILPQAKESFEASGSKIVVVDDKSMKRGMTGLMAGRLLKQFKVPCVVMATIEGGQVRASVRSPRSFNCRDFLASFSNLFQDFGGHACAAGFSLDRDKVNELLARLRETVDAMDCLDQDEETLEVDCSVPPRYMTPDLIRKVEFFEPYGEQNAELVFSIERAEVEEVTLLQNHGSGPQHVKLTLHYGTYRWPAVFWSAGDRVGKDFDKGDLVDVAFKLGRNYFRQHSQLQLTVLDVKRSA